MPCDAQIGFCGIVEANGRGPSRQRNAGTRNRRRRWR